MYSRASITQAIMKPIKESQELMQRLTSFSFVEVFVGQVVAEVTTWGVIENQEETLTVLEGSTHVNDESEKELVDYDQDLRVEQFREEIAFYEYGLNAFLCYNS